ncbi:DUF4148 domain-containing protein [bacterium M00.F.Ca.ET.228.01.1.1]|nr:DUF4148 domain-containing protein [bacterium M00.F.Ca.ET.228.01.1.1]TGS05089.1 DUF4148 domain-containing protein [bacterium M00.F.Ca.ET.191.01.1.1]TGU10024.1 DUF4148 domain-containing protein [bacterium M00.F.Ca.ET.155.01.1.1]
MSKILMRVTLVACALGAPALSFAQSNSQANAPLTRAEVRADLVRVERAGYRPTSGDDVNYPADIQAAEAKIAAEANGSLAAQAMGGVAQGGSSASGAASRTAMQPACVGPVSFCNPYAGS